MLLILQHRGHLNSPKSEFKVNANTYHVIGARISFLAIGGCFLIVAIETDKVAGIQSDFLIDIPCSAQT